MPHGLQQQINCVIVAATRLSTENRIDRGLVCISSRRIRPTAVLRNTGSPWWPEFKPGSQSQELTPAGLKDKLTEGAVAPIFSNFVRASTQYLVFQRRSAQNP